MDGEVALKMSASNDIISMLLSVRRLPNMIEEEIRQLLNTLTTESRKLYAQKFRELDIHIGQEAALCHLWEEDGISQTALRKQMGCEASTLSNMIRKLEQDGVVYRDKDERDGRSMNVFLTEKGKELQAPIQKIWTGQQEKMLEGILPEEQLFMRRLLQQMVENLENKLKSK